MKRILVKGNYALGEGAISAGCQAYFGYPITPQNELTAYMAKRMYEEKRVFIQAESEIAAINMVFGAAVAGVRVMTSSSSPGISLKQEGISYLAGCQLPAVIVNVQRGGPGLGNITGAQGDYFQAVKGGGHGDYKVIVLAPYSVEEMFTLIRDAFYLADVYRNPAMILTDGILGQMLEPVPQEISSLPPLKNVEKDWKLDGAKNRESRFIRSLLMDEGDLEKHVLKLFEKYKEIEEKEVRFAEENTENAEIILVAYGTSARICKSVLRRAMEKGYPVGLFRPITLYPFPTKRIFQLAQKIKAFLVIEMSMGQMVEDVKLAAQGKCRVEFYGRPGSGLPEEEKILEKIEEILKK